MKIWSDINMMDQKEDQLLLKTNKHLIIINIRKFEKDQLVILEKISLIAINHHISTVVSPWKIITKCQIRVLITNSLDFNINNKSISSFNKVINNSIYASKIPGIIICTKISFNQLLIFQNKRTDRRPNIEVEIMIYN